MELFLEWCGRGWKTSKGRKSGPSYCPLCLQAYHSQTIIGSKPIGTYLGTPLQLEQLFLLVGIVGVLIAMLSIYFWIPNNGKSSFRRVIQDLKSF